MLFESRQTFYKCLTNAAYLIHYKINFKILYRNTFGKFICSNIEENEIILI